ncbi:MAG: hypothetical protein ACOX2B_04530 [Syntrophothermaceae bacterium]|jgi:NAD(P)-dependent dehydrogenase (short-subunit alcohol dehydrogenase family)
MGKLDGKVVVVTGSVSAIPGFDSIGSATVREALAEGAKKDKNLERWNL